MMILWGLKYLRLKKMKKRQRVKMEALVLQAPTHPIWSVGVLWFREKLLRKARRLMT